MQFITTPLKAKKGCNVKRCKPLILLVPGVGIEPTRCQTTRDFKSYFLGFYHVV